MTPKPPTIVAPYKTVRPSRSSRLGWIDLAGVEVDAISTHHERHVDACLAAADDVFAELAEAIRRNDCQSRLEGPARHTGFARLS